MVHYGNDTTLVDQLIARKEREGLVQNHPEIDGVKMYWVLWICFIGMSWYVCMYVSIYLSISI